MVVWWTLSCVVAALAVTKPPVEVVPVPDQGEIALQATLKKIGTDLTVMCIAAHPDDEDGATLAYYGKHVGARTVAVIATRGEGGQNEIGPELYDELAVIRSGEQERAGAIYGSEIFFLNFPEFGFSKTAEETFGVWGHNRSLSEVVRIIREIRPDIVITNHDTISGHGHHQALGRLVIEAFDAAADPWRFVNQMTTGGLMPWQIKKLFVRCNGYAGCTPGDRHVTVPVGAYDRLRGFTYSQIAEEALRQHRSQGMGYFAGRIPNERHYQLLKSAVLGSRDAVDSLHDGLETSTVSARLSLDGSGATHEELAHRLARSLAQIRGERPRGAEMAADWLDLTSELEKALLLAVHFKLSAQIDDNVVVAGQDSVTVTAVVRNNGGLVLEISPPWLTGSSWEYPPALGRIDVPIVLDPDQTHTWRYTFSAPQSLAVTIPLEKHVFDNRTESPPLTMELPISVEGVPIHVSEAVRFEVAPPLVASARRSDALVRLGHTKRVRIPVSVTNYAAREDRGTVTIKPSWEASNLSDEFAVAPDEGQALVFFDLPVPDGLSPGTHPVAIVAEGVDGATSVDTVRLRADSVEIEEGLRVGIVRSYDSTIEDAVARLGVVPVMIDADALQTSDLVEFHTIVVDIRAYLVRPDLVTNNTRLLSYVHQGGHVVVMYQKTFEWNASYGRPLFAPYPLQLGRDRITVETAAIDMLAPDHPLLTWPNSLGRGDWADWVQERGLYFPSEYDEDNYTALLSSNDPGESPLKSGYLVANHGVGSYIYTSYVWYRQLRTGHPGAFRAFANMLSYPKRPR